jgi:hypothetical protein
MMEFDSDENIAMTLKQGYDASEVMSVASSSHHSMQVTPSGPHPGRSGSGVNFVPVVAEFPSRSTPPKQRELRRATSSGMSASRATRQRSTTTGGGISPHAASLAKAGQILLTAPSSGGNNNPRVTTSGSMLFNAGALRGLNVLAGPNLGSPGPLQRVSSFNASAVDYCQMTLDSDEDFTGTRAMIQNVFSIHGGKVPHPMIADLTSVKKELHASPEDSMKALKGHLGLASPQSHEKEKSPGRDLSAYGTSSLMAAPTLVIGVDSHAGTSTTGSDVLPSTVGSGTNPMLPSAVTPPKAAKQKGGSGSRATTPSGSSLRHRMRSYTPTSSGRRVSSRGRDGRAVSSILTTSARLL